MFEDWMMSEEKSNSNKIKIDIFDFDDTLIWVPSPNKAKSIIEKYNLNAKANGKKEVKQISVSGYWYAPESMEPPIIPDPCPCVMLNQKIAQEFYASQRDPRRLTVVMTGRPPHLRKHLDRILDDFKMKPERVYMMPEEGFVLDSKIQHIAKLLDEFPQVTEIEMWDDKGPTMAKLTGKSHYNHVAEFKKFLSICRNKRQKRDDCWTLKFKVNEVPPRDHEAVLELEKQNVNKRD